VFEEEGDPFGLNEDIKVSLFKCFTCGEEDEILSISKKNFTMI
jgi:hypothetical protein